MEYNKRRFFIFLSLIFFFVLGYEVYKGQIKIPLLKNNSFNNELYYCIDSSYTLIKNTCTKYVANKAYILGDVNLDNSVDFNDINVIKEFLDEKKELNSLQLKLADINQDSQVEMDDVSFLQEHISNEVDNIEKKLICDENYQLDKDICIKKVASEALKLDYLKGDINQNNKLDSMDLTLLDNYINNVSNLTETQMKIADYNDDQTINEKDYDKLKKQIKNKNISKIDKEQIVLNEFISLKFYKKKTIDKENGYVYFIDMIINDNNSYYYKWFSYNNNLITEVSECKLVNKNIMDDFIIKNNKENYGILTLYDDANCNNEVVTTKLIGR